MCIAASGEDPTVGGCAVIKKSTPVPWRRLREPYYPNPPAPPPLHLPPHFPSPSRTSSRAMPQTSIDLPFGKEIFSRFLCWYEKSIPSDRGFIKTRVKIYLESLILSGYIFFFPWLYGCPYFMHFILLGSLCLHENVYLFAAKAMLRWNMNVESFYFLFRWCFFTNGGWA